MGQICFPIKKLIERKLLARRKRLERRLSSPHSLQGVGECQPSSCLALSTLTWLGLSLLTAGGLEQLSPRAPFQPSAFPDSMREVFPLRADQDCSEAPAPGKEAALAFDLLMLTCRFCLLRQGLVLQHLGERRSCVAPPVSPSVQKSSPPGGQSAPAPLTTQPRLQDRLSAPTVLRCLRWTQQTQILAAVRAPSHVCGGGQGILG